MRQGRNAVSWCIYTTILLCSLGATAQASTTESAHSTDDVEFGVDPAASSTLPFVPLQSATSLDAAVPSHGVSVMAGTPTEISPNQTEWTQSAQRFERLELRSERGKKAGWGLVGSGGALMLAGSIMTGVCDNAENYVVPTGLVIGSLGGHALSTGAGMVAANRPSQRIYNQVQTALRDQSGTPDWNALSGALDALESVGKRQQLRGSLTLVAGAIVGGLGVFLMANDNFVFLGCPEKGCEKAHRQFGAGAIMVPLGFGAIAPAITILSAGRRNLRLARDLNGISDFSSYRARPAPQLSSSPTGFTLKF